MDVLAANDWEWLLGKTLPIVSVLLTAALGLAVYGIRKRLLKIEEARENDRRTDRLKAELRAEVKDIPRGTHGTIARHVLRIENIGVGTARNIELSLMDVRLCDSPYYVKEQTLPSELKGSAHYLIRLDTSSGRLASPLPLRIQWTDDTGKTDAIETSVLW